MTETDAERTSADPDQIYLDAERCTQCTLCAQVCPNLIFRVQDKRVVVHENTRRDCIRCGQCIAVCPAEGVSVGELDPEDFEPLSPSTVDEQQSAVNKLSQAGDSLPARSGWRVVALVALIALVTIGGGCDETVPSRPDGSSDGASRDGGAEVDGTNPDGARAEGGVTGDLTVRVDAGGDAGGPPLSTAPDPSCPPSGGGGADATKPGAPSFPHPTLTNISVLWPISGDANGNASVRVRYRPAGAGGWHDAQPLRRAHAGATPEGFSWPNRFAGSIFDVQSASTYEIELWLQDPDGGCAVEHGSVTTRAVPSDPPQPNVVQVTPETIAAALSAAAPGDVIELGAGSYEGFTLERDGAPGKPIVIRGSPGAIFSSQIVIRERKHVHLDKLTLRDRIRFGGSVGTSITRCRIESSGDGMTAHTRAEDAYIADNEVIGDDTWAESSLGASGNNSGEGIRVTGPGHVILHNRVTGFRDNISFWEGDSAVDQHSIDVLNNEIEVAADDGVEADFCLHNCRVMRNRLTNVFIALSSQPGLGGPTYFIRNVVYNNTYIAAFKLHRGSVGDVAYHNTVVKIGDAMAVTPGDEHTAQHFRNNVFIGGPGGSYGGWGSGDGRTLYLPDAGEVDFDYNGYGSTNGDFSGRVGAVKFADFAEMRAKTTEGHAVKVDLSIFAATVGFPSPPIPALPVPDLRLEPGASAVDAGEVLPNINDLYGGTAPDLGAYELGAPLPIYGPRP